MESYTFCWRKRFKVFMMILFLILYFIQACYPNKIFADEASEIYYGDVNDDKNINIVDLILLKSYIVANNKVDININTADINQSGDITSGDVIDLINYLDGNVKSLSRNIDSDGDGLTDYDEINVYRTDPLNEDTDSDNISDYSEIKLKLDPLNPVTDGVPDNEHLFEEKIAFDNEKLSVINTNNSPYVFSAEIKAAGDIENSLSITKSAYTHFLKNDAILGDIIDCTYYANLKVDYFTVRFSIDSDTIKNYYIFKPELFTKRHSCVNNF